MNYHNKKFRVKENSEHGELESGLIFHYQQEGKILFCQYSGGSILKGNLLGMVDENGKIEMTYHQINADFVHSTGTCNSTPLIQDNGKLLLFEKWQWTNGDKSTGESVLEEI